MVLSWQIRIDRMFYKWIGDFIAILCLQLLILTMKNL
jgi:hypothetical protein